MKKFLAVVLVFCLSLTLLAGCGGGVDPVATAKKNGNILMMGLSSINGVFNPIMSDQVYDNYVCDLVFDKMVNNTPDGEFVADCATWELSEDNLTYTFTLKDGTAFSDGTPLTAEDVAFTYMTMAHPDYDGPRDYAVSDMVGYKEYHDGEADTFEGIQVIDERTISFTFNEVSAAHINCFIYGILSKDYYAFETWEEFIALNDEPMGSGMMTFDSWALNEHVTLTTNKDYWNAEKQLQIDGVVMMNVPDDSILGALSTGAIDFAQVNADKDSYAELQGLKGIQTVRYLGNGYTYMCFNTTLPKLADVRVRQALMYALNRQAFVDATYGDLGSVGMAPISPTSWAYPDANDLNAYAYDQAKAAELMDAAGWIMADDGFRYKDGEKFTISWLVYEDAPWPGILAGMAYDSWLELGVELVIEKMDFNAVRARCQVPEPGEKDFEIYTMGFSLDIEPDPSGALFDADAYSAGGFNASGFRDERSQELILLGKSVFDKEERAAIYKEWAILQNELIPTVIVAYRAEIWGVNDRVSGLDIQTYQDWIQALPGVTLEHDEPEAEA